MRGKLLVYLGAAPGAGTTRRMLDEGRSRAERGRDVVLVDPDGAGAVPGVTAVPGFDVAVLLGRRPSVVLVEDMADARAAWSGAAAVGRATAEGSAAAEGRATAAGSADGDALGDLSDSAAEGHHVVTYRWQGIQTLLDAGIDVVTTLDVRHLDSLADVVHRITGVPRDVTVPDAVVRSADQIELVDADPETLRHRVRRGDLRGTGTAAPGIAPDLEGYYRIGNLAALRELALLWLADQVDEARSRGPARLGPERAAVEQHGPATAGSPGSGGSAGTREPQPRERIVVALPADDPAPDLLRRAARIARRARSAQAAPGAGGGAGGGASGGLGDDALLAVCVVRPGASVDTDSIAAQRGLTESLGGSHVVLVGEDVPAALIEFARARGATQLVLGASRRSRWARLRGGAGIGERTLAVAGDIDVHVVQTARDAGDPTRPRRVPRRRPAARTSGGAATAFDAALPNRVRGALAAALVPPALTALLSHVAHGLSLTSQVLLYLVAVVAIARLGGMLSALAAAIWASLLLDYYFISPIHSTSIADANNAIALVVFVAVGLTVASVVDLAAKQSRRAALASAEAETLNALAVAVLRGDEAITALLDGFRETFAVTSVALLQRTYADAAPRQQAERDPGRWTVVAAAGTAPPRVPAQADTLVAAGPDAVLALRGRTLSARDQRVLSAFAAQAAAALERRRLAQAAAHAANLEAADRMRTALLAAVSHDLRTPLAAARAAVGTLRDPELEVGPPDRAELLEVADESLDRLTRLVENLLDMSRLQAGALKPRLEPTAADEIVPIAVDEVPGAAGRVRLEPVAPGVPMMLADGPLLERVIVNLVGNAVRYTDTPIIITLTERDGLVELRCADRGPGIPENARDLVFRPFQRLGDRDNTVGVGLGLALARGLVEAMGGTLTPEPTPGGGVTMVVALPAAPPGPGPATGALPAPEAAGDDAVSPGGPDA